MFRFKVPASSSSGRIRTTLERTAAVSTSWLPKSTAGIFPGTFRCAQIAESVEASAAKLGSEGASRT
jgi:hypothetical protein